METKKLTLERKEAFIELLDDSSATVRQAMVAEFQGLGSEGVQMLKELAKGTNRVLAWHANWFLGELKFCDPAAEFKDFIRSLHYELETGALLLSRSVNADLDIGSACTILDQIAGRCRELIVEPASPRDKCRVLNRVLFHEYGFRGNIEHYSDPLNSFIDQVLIRRKGIPTSLSIVYLLVAHRVGLTLEPVGLPGHFMVGCYMDEVPFFVDCFEKGVFCSPEQVFAQLRENKIDPKNTDLAPTPVREVLYRCCRILVSHFTAANNPQHAQLFAEFAEEFEATYERHAQS